jgi:hypothetical protein
MARVYGEREAGVHELQTIHDGRRDTFKAWARLAQKSFPVLTFVALSRVADGYVRLGVRVQPLKPSLNPYP